MTVGKVQKQVSFAPAVTFASTANDEKVDQVAATQIEKAVKIQKELPQTIFLSEPLHNSFEEYATLHVELVKKSVHHESVDKYLIALMMINRSVLRGIQFKTSKENADEKLKKLCLEAEERLKNKVEISKEVFDWILDLFFHFEQSLISNDKIYSKKLLKDAFYIYANLHEHLKTFENLTFEQIDEIYLEIFIKNIGFRDVAKILSIHRGFYDILMLSILAETAQPSQNQNIREFAKSANDLLVEKGIEKLTDEINLIRCQEALVYYYKINVILIKKFPKKETRENIIIAILSQNQDFFEGLKESRFRHLCTKLELEEPPLETEIILPEVRRLESEFDKMTKVITEKIPLKWTEKSLELKQKVHEELLKINPSFSEEARKEIWVIVLAKNPFWSKAFKGHIERCEKIPLAEDLEWTQAQYYSVEPTGIPGVFLKLYEQVRKRLLKELTVPEDLMELAVEDSKESDLKINLTKENQNKFIRSIVVAFEAPSAQLTNVKKVCAKCNKENPEERCTKCFTLYCNPICQKADWRKHRSVCKKKSTTTIKGRIG